MEIRPGWKGRQKRLTDKKRLEDLAIFGGSAAFHEPLHVGRPNVGDRERLLGRINEIIDSKRLTNNGPYVQGFERTISEMIGVKHCIAVSNATVGLEIAAQAAGLSGEVIVPSFTFVATAHALRWQGITPIFCDVDEQTHNIDPEQVERLITPRTTGIMGVHLWGRPCDATALAEIAHAHDLRILFDAAHAFGCSYEGTMLGNYGDAEVFSFHATKFVNAFEGGAIVTNDDKLADKMRLMKNFGFAGYDKVLDIGTNGKMSEVSAAMGLTSLESRDTFVAANYRNYRRYGENLARVPGVRLAPYSEEESCNYQYIVLEIDEGLTRVSRDRLQEILWAENVLARRYFYPGCHRMEPYRSSSLYRELWLPNTERLSGRVLSLPTGMDIGVKEIDRICEAIEVAVACGGEVRKRLDHYAAQESAG
jgi:dTDP-4-amino-4,6-dideoxygalactose transaminase